MENSVNHLTMLASAIAGRDLQVSDAGGDTPPWCDGNKIYISKDQSSQIQLQQLCVQSALIASGGLDPEILRRLARRQKQAQRYLCLEGWRALSLVSDLLPPIMQSLLSQMPANLTDSAEQSLAMALAKNEVQPTPALFGEMQTKKLLAATKQAGGATSKGQHIPRSQQQKPLEELSDDANEDEEDKEDFSTSPVGGGGGLGKQLQKLFQRVRKLKGGDSPGADTATHWSRSGSRSTVRAVSSTASTESVDDVFTSTSGLLYPEWNYHSKRYRRDWCTVIEVKPPTETQANVEWLTGHGLRKPLSQLGLELDRFRRQSQGDDIDIDAAIESQIELMAGSHPDTRYYIESQRHRRDLSVLILLDISGSVSQQSQTGVSVHEQQRAMAAELCTVLYEIGDRVSLYGFHSQGRSTVNLVPVKRFDENLDGTVMNRLHSLIPGAYSRLGAAIRHGSHVITEQGGTARRLLVVLSDGLAYDHGYEPAYGAADARKALSEARQDGVGCLCLSLGANTDTEVLRRVFGSAAFATIPKPEQVGRMIGPLFRSALKAAEVQRRVA